MPDSYVEILQDSRPISIGRTSAEQSITIQFQLDEDESPVYSQAEFLGADDDVVALEYAYTIFPYSRWLPGQEGNDLFLIITSLKVSQVSNTGWWKATADYKYDLNTGEGGERGGDPAAQTLPFIKVGFSVGSRTTTITQSLQVLSTDGNADTPLRPNPDGDVNGNAIGVSEDSVTGAEVYNGGLNLQITVYYFPQFITLSFLNLLAQYCSPRCSTNSDNVLGYQPGEVLLLGADGSATVTDIVPITFSLEVKRNVIAQADLPFPPLTCPGHSALDYRYVKELDEDAKQLLQLPTYRLVHRVYPSRPFASLGFPQ